MLNILYSSLSSNMSLDKKDIQKIAYLARLSIAEEAIPRYRKSLSEILQLVDRMNTAETEAVTPLAHPLHMNSPLREDVVTETDQHVYFQQQAPATADGLYLVPKVIE